MNVLSLQRCCVLDICTVNFYCVQKKHRITFQTAGAIKKMRKGPHQINIFICNVHTYILICRVLVCERACVRHTRACVNLGAKEVRSFMDLCVRMCVRAGYFGCVTCVRSHLKFFNKIMKKRLKTKGFQWQSGILIFN